MVKAEVKEEEIVLLDLKLVKKHLRIEEDYVEDDDLIELYTSSALAVAENYTGRKFAKGQLTIEQTNVSDITIERLSLNDKVQKVEVMEEGVDSIILPASSYSSVQMNNEVYILKLKQVELSAGQKIKVTIDYGYSSKTLPKPIRSAMLLSIGESFEKREDRAQGNNSAMNNLLRPYKKW